MRGILRLLKWLLALGAIGGAIYWFRFSPVVVQEHTVDHGELLEEVLGTGTLDHRALNVFDTTYEMEDGVFRRSS